MNWLYRMQHKYGKYAIRNLMLIIVVGQFAVFVADLLFLNIATSALYLSRELVMRGQIWRLITFIFIPPNTSIVFILFSLYFYYMIGGALENEWGPFLFNMYYLIGVIGAIAAGMISEIGNTFYLNMSMFFAFAILYPDFEIMVFFVLPVKMKYLAVIDAVLFVISFINGTWSSRMAILFSLANLAIFFGGTFFKKIRQERAYRETRRNFRDQMRDWNR